MVQVLGFAIYGYVFGLIEGWATKSSRLKRGTKPNIIARINSELYDHAVRYPMRYKRVQIPGATYFFTVNLANRANRLLMDHIDIHRQSMQQTKQHHPFSIDAIVILPDHIHTIWILPKYRI